MEIIKIHKAVENLLEIGKLMPEGILSNFHFPSRAVTFPIDFLLSFYETHTHKREKNVLVLIQGLFSLFSQHFAFNTKLSFSLVASINTPEDFFFV
jgi:hypothetical protein